jgi:RNA polymerase sigma-70 factor (ECF subfamily)
MTSEDATLDSARSGDQGAFARLVAPYRRELRAHCYRMSGSLHDADDLLQESLLRAWRGLATFAGRSSLRTWLYRVTTHACLDTLEKKSARLLPMDLGPAADPSHPMSGPRLEPIWLEPCPADLYEDFAPSPEAAYGQRESVALAFLVALQTLPAKQRAVLILRDVLGWQARECAELLDLSVAAVNSALVRARETIASRVQGGPIEPAVIEADTLLVRYVDAWERADVAALVSLLHQDATLAMPPLSEWLSGADAIGTSIAGMLFGPAGPGVFRMVATRANGRPAFAAYQRDRATGAFHAMGIQVLELRDGRIAGVMAFLDPSLLPAFGLPSVLPA